MISGLAERSPQSKTVPTNALTRCLKLRGVLDSAHTDEREVKRQLYSKLGNSVPVHFAVVRNNEACVYMMFDRLESAKRAFDLFHTHWFNGLSWLWLYFY